MRTTLHDRGRSPRDHAHRAEAHPSTIAADARSGLAHAPRSIPPKHFYDAVGSRLFDRICELPEYYLTRAEHRLLGASSADIAQRSRATSLVELGSGMARKTGLLLAALTAQAHAPVTYVPFDISPDALEASARALMAMDSGLRVRCVVGEFPRDLSRLREVTEPGLAPRLFAFLGSTIGNLDVHEAPALLAAARREMAPGDAFLLGVDLVKDERALVAAYDDSAGVTAAFNKNVLAVMNRELDADFDLDAFAHEATWSAERSRMEMRLVSLVSQRVSLRAIDLTIDLTEGERILTEISRKFTRESAERTLRAGGMRLDTWYVAEDGGYALALARA